MVAAAPGEVPVSSVLRLGGFGGDQELGIVGPDLDSSPIGEVERERHPLWARLRIHADRHRGMELDIVAVPVLVLRTPVRNRPRACTHGA